MPLLRRCPHAHLEDCAILAQLGGKYADSPTLASDCVQDFAGDHREEGRIDGGRKGDLTIPLLGIPDL